MSRFIRILSLAVAAIVVMSVQLQAEDTSPPTSLAKAGVWQPNRSVFSEYRLFFDYPSPDDNFTKFWAYNYIPGVTHTGFDYNLGDNTAHVYVPWNAFGKVQETFAYPASLNKASIVTVRQLLHNGDYLYCKGLHFYAGSIRVAPAYYVAQGHLIAREGNTGVNSTYVGDDEKTHLHYECGNLGPTPWVSSSSTCPDSAYAGETVYCAPDSLGRVVLRDTSRDIDGVLLAHYDRNNTGKVWYSPQEFVRQYSELIPCLSRSTASSCATTAGGYDVYGVANRPLYGQLNARGVFDEVGILVRIGDSILRANAETSTFSSTLGDDRKWLARSTGSVNGITGQRTDYGLGDYLFLATVLKGERRYGFPLRVSFVAEGDFIVDNDKPLDGGASYEDNLEALASRLPILANPVNPDLPKIYPYRNDLLDRVPGYFMTASLVRGRTGAFARWRVGQTGFVKLWVFVPRGATATSVQYKIVNGGNVTLSAPIDQAANQERWVQLSSEAGISFFDLSAGGYVGIYLAAAPGGAADQHNYLSVSADQKVGFDAVKFEHGGACRAATCTTLTAINVSGPSSMNENTSGTYTAMATFSDGTSSNVTTGAIWSENSSATTISTAGVLSAGSVSSNQAVTVTATYTSNGVTRSGTKTVTIVDVPKTLSSVTVSGPSSMNENTSVAYTATATFSDGSSSTVTTSAIWSENSSATTISTAGVLSAGSVSSNQSVTVTASYTYNGVTRSGTKAVTVVNLLTYTSSPSPGTYTSGGNVLKVKATFNGSNVTFTVAKQDGSAFTTSGVMTIRAGASYGCVANNNTYYWSYSSGATTTTATFNLSQYFTSGSKDLFAAIGRPSTYCDGTPPTYYSGKLTITAQ